MLISVENETFCLWWLKERRTRNKSSPSLIFICYVQKRNEKSNSSFLFGCLRELMSDRMMNLISWKCACIYTWTDRPERIFWCIRPAVRVKNKQNKKQIERDVTLFVRDKNYPNNFKNNFEIETQLMTFVLFIQNIGELIIFHRKNRKFWIQNLCFTRFWLILTDNFCHEQTISHP